MKGLGFGGVLIAGAMLLVACGEDAPDVVFDYGVASGDPLTDSVILWTRATPVVVEGEEAPATIMVEWEIATDEATENVVAEGSFETSAERDYTVKVDASGLAPGTTYYYQFEVGDLESAVGRTRTLPEGSIDRATFAVVSCSNFPFGFFNVYKSIADRDDVDAVLHLGDYFYEYGNNGYGADVSEATGRGFEPEHEIVSLEDYRMRHAQYRRDADLQAMIARHPLIAVWDDHETANNSHRDGAANHNEDEGEGDWEVRKTVAVQAYHEWMPTRLPDPLDPLKTFRSFQYGDLASLIMVDTRLYGRDEQYDYGNMDHIPMLSFPFDFSDPLNPKPVMDGDEAAKLGPEDVKMVPTPFDVTGEEPQPILDYPRILQMDPDNMPDGIAFIPDADKFINEVLADPSRSMLGLEQEEWLRDEMAASKAAGVTWQIVGQQLLIGRVPMPDFSAQLKPDPESFWTQQRIDRMNMGAKLGLPFNLDAWDGYSAARDRFSSDVLANANNVLVLSGDTHNAWAFDLQKSLGDSPYASELATPGISSPGMDRGLPFDLDFAKEQIKAVSPELVYLNNRDRGYMMVTLTPEAATTAWYFVDTVLTRDFTVTCEKALQTKATDAPGVSPLQEVPCR